MSQTTDVHDDVWIHTQCAKCYAACAIRVHRVNGVAVKIEGEPDSTMGAGGGICAKGLSALQVLYDPNRLKTPLRRTNPEKGIGVDPQWQEITWEEAFAEIVPRLKQIMEDDPKKLVYHAAATANPGFTTGGVPYLISLGPTIGFASGANLHCGGATHPTGGIIHGSWSIVPDFEHCKYAIYFGASKGHGSGHSAMTAARSVADARAKGMKLVVFDPMCNFAGGKADDWVPIIPGTDLVVILAMCNIIVNELGVIDEPFLKLKTNAPYLVGPDMKYVREKGPARGVKAHSETGETVTGIGDDETNKPMVWDAGEGKAKVFDDPTIKDYALEGDHEFRGIQCRPAFSLLKEHFRQYTPEMASRISTVPVHTIRRIATEFASEARVGSTISINGQVLPYRPVSAVLFRGGQGHENSYHTAFAVSLLTALVGAIEVPGGTVSWPARTLGFPDREDQDSGGWKWSVFKGVDGFLQSERFGPGSGRSSSAAGTHGMWPIPMPELRHLSSLRDIKPIGCTGQYIPGGSDREEVWKKVGATYAPEMLITSKNPVMSIGNHDALAAALKAIPFVVVIELVNSETTEGFADIVLPDTCFLQKDNWATGLAQNFNHAWGMADWTYHACEHVIGPLGSQKHADEIEYEIVKRLGAAMGRDFVREANEKFIKASPIKTEYRPDAGKGRLTVAEIGDAVVRSMFGPEHDWDWFNQHGFILWPKRVEEAYWMWYLDLRIPVYMEWLAHMKDAIEKINRDTGLGIDTAHYTPLVSWLPCTSHKVTDPGFDLYCYSYRDTLHSGSTTMEQPWLDEASRMNPYTYNITMNAHTGAARGLSEGDAVEVQSYLGRRVTGTLKLMEGHHPLTVGIAATAGHWAMGQPVARGKGTNFDNLLAMDFEHMDPVCGTIETAVRVSVRKI